MRLDKFLSDAGYGSRKEVKSLIKSNRIKVNEVIQNRDSFHLDPNKDEVKIDDQIIVYRKFLYVLLYKPKGYVSATEDTRYPPVTNLVLEYNYANLFPVGRLDVDTTGLLLLTNDGNLTHRLLSPKNHVDKVYEVIVDQPLQNNLISAFQNGIILDGEKTLPALLTIESEFKAQIILHEGKFHQVKRMFAYFGYQVIALNRSRFDILTLENLKEGEYRLLSDFEIEELKKH